MSTFAYRLTIRTEIKKECQKTITINLCRAMPCMSYGVHCNQIQLSKLPKITEFHKNFGAMLY